VASEKAPKSSKNKDAARLIDLRQSLGFNQREMAKEFGVTQGAVGLWERGERPVTGPVLKLIEIYEKKL
jgi:transcriptional regulator with XRE-family HTH domain